MREYEKHQSQNGQPPSHQFAKEMMAGIAGAEASQLHISFCKRDWQLHQIPVSVLLHHCAGRQAG